MKRSWRLAASVAVAAGALAVPAVVSATSPGDPGGPGRPGGRLELVCARVPNLTLRVDAGIARLEGDATTRGSLAWLQAQIDKATADGRTQLVTVLENRLDVRTARLDLLKARRVALGNIAEICAERGA